MDEQAKSYADHEPERLAESRYAVHEESVLFIAGDRVPISSHIVELSPEGCHVRTSREVAARARLPVEILFKVKGTAFRFSGVVEWWSEGNLLGIRFANMNDERMVTLAKAICEMDAAAAAGAVAAKSQVPAWKPHAGPSPPPRQPEAAAGQTAPETGAATAALKRFHRQDDRQEINYTATVLLVNVGAILRGRILDLSLGGCRIRTDARFPVGIYTRVETEFRAEGLSFRLGGVIQAIHDSRTVGIRFLDLSQRKRQQVLELIEEIKQIHAAAATAEPAAQVEQAMADGH